jgi:hypothetical protein
MGVFFRDTNYLFLGVKAEYFFRNFTLVLMVNYGVSEYCFSSWSRQNIFFSNTDIQNILSIKKT